VCPQKIPSEGEVAELYLRGEITKGHAACLMKMHGLSPALIDASFSSKREKIGHREIIEASIRFPTLVTDQDKWLQDQGWVDDEERSAIKQLFVEVPSIKDHLEWL